MPCSCASAVRSFAAGVAVRSRTNWRVERKAAPTGAPAEPDPDRTVERDDETIALGPGRPRSASGTTRPRRGRASDETRTCYSRLHAPRRRRGQHQHRGGRLRSRRRARGRGARPLAARDARAPHLRRVRGHAARAVSARRAALEDRRRHRLDGGAAGALRASRSSSSSTCACGRSWSAPGIKTGMPILYDNPKEVGADRIVNAVAAYERFKAGCIIVDFGTATTFDLVTPKGEYAGGAIATGITTSADALYEKAAKLPRVEFTRPASVVGKNTVASMQAGLFYGYVGLTDEIVTRMRAERRLPVHGRGHRRAGAADRQGLQDDRAHRRDADADRPRPLVGAQSVMVATDDGADAARDAAAGGGARGRGEGAAADEAHGGARPGAVAAGRSGDRALSALVRRRRRGEVGGVQDARPSCPTRILGGALEQPLDARVLDFFARRVFSKPPLLEKLLLNKATSRRDLPPPGHARRREPAWR